MASSLTPQKRARRYLQASMSAGYTGLPAEHREAYEDQMRSHERAYPGVREHALAGADSDFDKPLAAGEREHQGKLRERAGMQHADVLRVRRELRGGSTPRGAPARRRGRLAGPRVAKAAAGAAGGALSEVTGGGSTFMYFIGVLLLLSLAYLLLSEKGKGPQLVTGIIGTLVGGVRAFVAPVDPIASLEKGLGAGSVSAPTSAVPSSAAPTAAAAIGAAEAIGADVGAALGGASYVAPFSGAKAGRVDQGQDFTLAPGAPIRAIGAGKVTAIIKDWFKGQPLIAYQLSSGPARGRTVYVAEQISPSVRVGQSLAAGQVIGQYARSGTGIELGWARPSGQTLANATTGYVEGQVTAAGKSISSFLSSLGVPTK